MAPVNAAISPTFSGTEATLDAISNASFYAEAAAIGKLTGTKKHRATIAHFEKVFIFLVDPKSSKAASLYSFAIACAALTSCFMLFLQTLDGPNHQSTFPDYPSLPDESGYFVSDLVFTVIFTAELLVRIAIWPSFWHEHEYLSERRLKPFLRDVFNWFDAMAIIPFYTDLLVGKDKSFVLMRLCRLLRIFKLARNHSGTYILLRAIRASLAPISIALIFFMEIVMFFSVVMYMVDPNLDRNKNGFSDLLTTGYFVVVTVATIGYGDITPTKGNMPGRVFSVMIIMSGTLFLSMPLAIIGTEFDRAWKEHAESVKKYEALGTSGGAHLAGGADLAAVNDSDRERKHEVLIKYNAPSRLYLRLAGLTGEASLMVQALLSEVDYAASFSVTRTLEIAEDLQAQLDACCSKFDELGSLVREMVVPYVEHAAETPTWRQWLFRALSDPSSSLAGRYFAKWVRFCQVASMVLVVFQTMPDLQTYGETTFLCERIVQRYCENAADVTPLADPGCFRVDSPLLPLRFGCSDSEKLTDPSCFGYGLNYGAAHAYGLTCDNGTTVVPKRDAEDVASSATGAIVTNLTHYVGDISLINPFRLDADLSVADRKLAVCKKWECDNLHVTFFEFGSAYVAAEYVFALTFVLEFAAALFICADRRAHFKNPVVVIELLSFAPFVVMETSRVVRGSAPIYVIPPGSSDVLTFLRLLRLVRIFKIQQSIPVTKVLWESISKTSTRLTIPYFMLMVVTTIFSFIMYELEKGQECFYGRECIVNGKNMTEPPELVGSVPNKRFLVNPKGNLSTFDDFFSAFWFVIVTIATIGYGDMEPVSPSGKLVAVAAMIFGACYTAMPLTLVGSQFNKSYREHKRREALLRTKVEVSKPFEILKTDFDTWSAFAASTAFARMQRIATDELVPVLERMRDEELIDERKKARVVEATSELRDLVYAVRLDVMKVSVIVNSLRKEGVRLAEQQTTALKSIT